MPKFLLSIFRSNDYDPKVREDDKMREEIDELNRSMQSAGVRIFAGGLHGLSFAKTIVAKDGGELEVLDRHYLLTNEHVGGFWILELSNESAAIEWGRRASVACRAPVEIRQFH